MYPGGFKVDGPGGCIIPNFRFSASVADQHIEITPVANGRACAEAAAEQSWIHHERVALGQALVVPTPPG